MKRVGVELGDRRYDVIIGAGAVGALDECLERGAPRARRVAVVTQAGLPAIELERPHDVHLIGDGERAKSLATIEELCRAFVTSGLGRADAIVAVGGGVVTDVAGFAAATFHRGIAYVNVATSLLGQVDAAIGGKTAVNLPEGKNLVGAFWQPSAVICDTDHLRTLPAREWASGRGEMAKYALLGSPRADATIVDLPIDEQVARCVAIKADVVAADEREGDRRAILNYGHTLAHALEALDYDAGLRHGEAVAIGLGFAARLAERLGRIDAERVALHDRVVGAFDLSGALPTGTSSADVLELMGRDKKAEHDLTFVLDGPAGVETVRGVGPDDVLATLMGMGARS